jgi:hypothetical protein
MTVFRACHLASVLWPRKMIRSLGQVEIEEPRLQRLDGFGTQAKAGLMRGTFFLLCDLTGSVHTHNEHPRQSKPLPFPFQ